MRKLMLCLAAAACVGAVSPALAAKDDLATASSAMDDTLLASEQRIDWQITRAENAGRIGPDEAAAVRQQLAAVRDLRAEYGSDGMSASEYDKLRDRLNALTERADRDFYG
jgi:hypothetical protein